MTSEIKGFDVLIVGGGAIGCAVGRRIAAAGARVGIVEKDRPGGGATWAAAGMLTQLAEGGAAHEFGDLCAASLSLYPEFVEALQAETGLEVGFRRMETVLAALTDEDAVRLTNRLAVQIGRGVRVEWQDGDRLREVEPSLSTDVRGGLLLLDEGQVDNRALGRALWSAAVLSGVEVIDRRMVTGVDVRSGRVRGVHTADGSIGADLVIVAGGAWSGQLAGLPHPLPVRPVRGQMLAVESVPLRINRMMSADHVYIVPRPGGRSLVGATVEEAGFEARTTAGGLRTLLEGALRLLPALADAPVVETWAGLRPGTPDDMPILGRDPELHGLLYATGHFMNGILLTPITAQILDALIRGVSLPIDIEPYGPARFTGNDRLPGPTVDPLAVSD